MIDWAQLDAIADGFSPEFAEIYGEFQDNLHGLLRAAAAALAEGDPARLARLAHQTKGSAANFGFTDFTVQMARIEARAAAGALAGLEGELERATAIFRHSIREVTRHRGG